jgi:catechol 2,3-dioxygenase-like lactoylglutathione lyase family enzyme
VTGPVPVRRLLLILAVEDLGRARRFWDAAFGWEVAAEVPVYVEYRVAPSLGLGLYARGGFARNTGIPPAAVPPGGIAATEVYLLVDDLPAAVRRLEAAGARLLSPAAAREWGDEAAYFADPDGNVVVVAVGR